MENKTKTDLSKYIVNVQGRDFITLNGLLHEAHHQGLLAIETQMINTDLQNPVFKTSVHMKGETLPSGQPQIKLFTGHGDANSSNVAKKVAGALVRMAESRSIGRALRFATNIDMVAIEELDTEENVIGDRPVEIKKFQKPTITQSLTEGFTTAPSLPTQVDSGTLVVKTDTSGTVPISNTTVPVKRSFNKRPTQTKEPNFPG